MSQLLNSRKNTFMQQAALLTLHNNQNQFQNGTNSQLNRDSKNGSGLEFAKNNSNFNNDVYNYKKTMNLNKLPQNENKQNPSQNNNSYQNSKLNFSEFGNTQQSQQFYNPENLIQKNVQNNALNNQNEQTTQYSGFNQSIYNSDKNKQFKQNQAVTKFDYDQYDDKKDTVQFDSQKDDYLEDNSFYNELLKTPIPEKKKIIENIPVKKEQFNTFQKVEIQQPQLEMQNENQLFECSKGCGRKFLRKALDIHQNICLKVFQKKRDEFDSKKTRVIDDEQERFGKINEIKEKRNQKKEGKKKLNWKKQSEAFRAAMKTGQGQELTQEEEENLQKFNEMIACEFCGRRFDEKLAQKHIFRCEQNANKMNY